MQIKASQTVSVPGLGVIEAGNWTDLDDAQIARFERKHGHPITEMNSTVLELREKPAPKKKKKEDS